MLILLFPLSLFKYPYYCDNFFFFHHYHNCTDLVSRHVILLHSAVLNRFTGPLILPANLNPLVRQLNVSFNQLAGPFLMQAGELGSFSMLDASHNHLTGPLPASLNQVCLNVRMFVEVLFECLSVYCLCVPTLHLLLLKVFHVRRLSSRVLCLCSLLLLCAAE